MAPELFKSIRRIHIQTNRLARDILAGLYRSAFKGRGMEFEEVREYQPGDDIRSIDWPVTSRMNHPYVKLFREERELTVMLLVDVSCSTRFGSLEELKSELIAEIGAVLAFSAIKNNDKVGLILFTTEVELYIPPSGSVRHVLRVIRELLAFKGKHKGTDIGKALAFLGHVQSKQCVCFLLSDFICPDYSHEAAVLATHHDLIAISITDPRETAFPRMQLAVLEDLESGKVDLFDTSDAAFQHSLSEASENRIRQQKQLMDSLGAGFIDIRADKPYVPVLRKFFKLRSVYPK